MPTNPTLAAAMVALEATRQNLYTVVWNNPASPSSSLNGSAADLAAKQATVQAAITALGGDADLIAARIAYMSAFADAGTAMMVARDFAGT